MLSLELLGDPLTNEMRRSRRSQHPKNACRQAGRGDQTDNSSFSKPDHRKNAAATPRT
jgi:hypothetical protein